jgi:hypothetical protein
MDLKKPTNQTVTILKMATRAEAEEDLRIAQLVLSVAMDNNYDKVICYLEDNVRKAKAALNKFDKFSPTRLFSMLLEHVAPTPSEQGLPFTSKNTLQPLKKVYVNDGPGTP